MECPAKNNLEAEVGEGGATLETSLSTGPSCLAGALAQDFRGSEGVRERVWDWESGPGTQLFASRCTVDTCFCFWVRNGQHDADRGETSPCLAAAASQGLLVRSKHCGPSNPRREEMQIQCHFNVKVTSKRQTERPQATPSNMSSVTDETACL